MTETHEQMLYKDWLNLTIHLLWGYDHRVIQDPVVGGARSYAAYSNNGAWLVREGWAEVESAGKVTRAEPGQWLIIKPGKRIQTFAATTHLLSIAFDARWPDGTCLLDEGLSLVLPASEHPGLERAALPIAEAFGKISRQGWNIFNHQIGAHDYFQLDALLAAWLAELVASLARVGVEYTGKANLDPRVMKAVRIIRTLPLNEPLDTQLLAQACTTSEVHLLRIFRQEIRCTPREFLNKLRLEQACNYLRLPNTRVKEVASRLGFRHLSHFSRWFQTQAGSTPRDYLRHHRANAAAGPARE